MGGGGRRCFKGGNPWGKFSSTKIYIVTYNICFFFFKGMNDVFNIKVWCFQQMSNVLKAAGEKKVKEVQICLEGS